MAQKRGPVSCWTCSRALRKINQIYNPYVLKNSSQALQPSLPGLMVYLRGLILCRPLRIQLKQTWKIQGNNPHFLCTRQILDLMRRLDNSWSPLTHASHCMTTSRPAADIQTTERVTPAMHAPKVFLCRMPFRPQPSLFPGLGPAQNTLAWTVSVY